MKHVVVMSLSMFHWKKSTRDEQRTLKLNFCENTHLAVPQFGERIDNDTEDDVETNGGDDDEEGYVKNRLPEVPHEIRAIFWQANVVLIKEAHDHASVDHSHCASPHCFAKISLLVVEKFAVKGKANESINVKEDQAVDEDPQQGQPVPSDGKNHAPQQLVVHGDVQQMKSKKIAPRNRAQNRAGEKKL